MYQPVPQPQATPDWICGGMQSRDGGKLDFSSHPSVSTRFSQSVHPLIFPLLHLLHFPASPGVRYAAAAISSVLPLLFRSHALIAAMHVVFTSAGGKLLYWQAGLWAFVKVVQGVFAAHIAVMKLPAAFPTEQFAPPCMLQPSLRQKKFPLNPQWGRICRELSALTGWGFISL